MRAVGIMDIGKIQMVDIPKPHITEYECLVKMHACGFCNCTDTESVYNCHIHKDMPFPHVQGHEGVGEIVEMGSKVFSYSLGDRIVFPEGRIEPESGFFMCGCGHFADYCIVRDCEALKRDGLPLGSQFADWPRKFPKEISWLDATMITPIRETYSACKNLKIGPETKVLILGDGPSGFGLALFAKYLGASLVIVAGHRENRLKKAKERAHADIVVNSNEVDVFTEYKDKVNLVIDAVGKQENIIKGSHTVSLGGMVCLYACIRKDKKMLDLHEFGNDVGLYKMYSPSRDLMRHEECIDLILKGVADPRDFYDHVLPMSGFEKAMNMIRDREAFKVVLDFDMPD